MIKRYAAVFALAALALAACGGNVLGPHGVAGTQNPPSATGFERGALPFTSQASIAMGKTFPKSISPGKIPAGPMKMAPILPAGWMEAHTHRAAMPQSLQGGLSWSQLTGSVSEAIVGSGEGSLWALSSSPQSGDRPIFHYSAGTWTQIPGAAARLAITPDGTTLYALNAEGSIYMYAIATGTWTALSGGASDLTVAADGTLYVLSNGGGNGGNYGVWHLANGTWTQLPGAASRISAFWDPSYYTVNGNTIGPYGFFVFNSTGAIFYYNPTSGGYIQMPGAASWMAPVTSGLFVVGSPAINNGGAPIYYYDFTHPGWAEEPGAASSISGSTTQLYAVNALGYIYLSPIGIVAPLPAMPFNLTFNLPGMWYGEVLAQMPNAAAPRDMTFLPNGDLIVGTGGGTALPNNQVYIIPNADSTTLPGPPSVFVTMKDTGTCAGFNGTNTHGVSFAPSSGGGTIYVGMECSVWAIPYKTGDQTASSAPQQILSVRTGAESGQNGDTDDHHTTSVLAVGNSLYVGVGSSCNACVESDPTRAVVLRTNLQGGSQTTVATELRNPLSLAVNPVTGAVWAGGAGQDCVSTASPAPATPPPTCVAQDPIYATDGHPYEFLDPVTLHAAPANYMWPACEEKNVQEFPNSGTYAGPNYNCANMIVGLVRTPAYATILGATFYPAYASSPPQYAFPTGYQGGLFMSLHGSWHENYPSGIQVAVPQVVFVPMKGDTPIYPMNWSQGGVPESQWARDSSGNPDAFIAGFQDRSGIRYGRPSGVTVGPNGSLFIADDYAGLIYRVRPGSAPPAEKPLQPSVFRKRPG